MVLKMGLLSSCTPGSWRGRVGGWRQLQEFLELLEHILKTTDLGSPTSLLWFLGASPGFRVPVHGSLAML